MATSRPGCEDSGNMNRYSLILAALGCLYIVIFPPFQVPDAPDHFYRAYQIAHGQFISQMKDGQTGGNNPVSLNQLVRRFSALPFQPENKIQPEQIINGFAITLNHQSQVFYSFENTALFSPLPYLPAALGIRLASFATDSVLALYYAAGIFTLLTSVAIIHLAGKILPAHRMLILLIAVTPMFLFEMASFSSDSISNSLSILFICLFCSVITVQRLADSQFIIQIILCGVALALCKQTYSVLFVLTVLLTPRYFYNTKKWLGYQCLFCTTVLLTIIGWGVIAEQIYAPFNNGKGIDAKAQLANVIANFSWFLEIMWYKDISNNFVEYIEVMIGSKLGWLETELPRKLIRLMGGTLVFYILIFVPRIPMTSLQIAVCIFTIILGIMLVELALYMHTRPVGSSTILGIHGRYFIPLFFLLLITLAGLADRLKITAEIIPIVKTAALALFCISWGMTIPIIIQRYYL